MEGIRLLPLTILYVVDWRCCSWTESRVIKKGDRKIKQIKNIKKPVVFVLRVCRAPSPPCRVYPQTGTRCSNQSIASFFFFLSNGVIKTVTTVSKAYLSCYFQLQERNNFNGKWTFKQDYTKEVWARATLYPRVFYTVISITVGSQDFV